jgi:hypothetical protein
VVFFTKFIKTYDLVAVTTLDFDSISRMKVLKAFRNQPERNAERKVIKAVRT